MEIVIFNESGKKRRGIKYNCEYCGKEFIRRKNPIKGRENKKYCSRECSFKYKIAETIRVKVICRNCEKELKVTESRFKRSRKKIFFCCRKCKDEAQKIGGKCPEIQPAHYGTSTYVPYRKVYKEETGIEKLKCFRCQYEEFESVVEIHHIDRNKENNEIENLIPLCANCHRAVTLGQLDIYSMIQEHNEFLIGIKCLIRE